MLLIAVRRLLACLLWMALLDSSNQRRDWLARPKQNFQIRNEDAIDLVTNYRCGGGGGHVPNPYPIGRRRLGQHTGQKLMSLRWGGTATPPNDDDDDVMTAYNMVVGMLCVTSCSCRGVALTHHREVQNNNNNTWPNLCSLLVTIKSSER